MTRQQAIDYVVNTIIDTTATKPILRAYALQSPISPNTPIVQNAVDTLGTSPGVSTWFIWIDLNPIVLFAHPTQFVMVNSGGLVIDTIVVIDGTLWPTINGITYYSTELERETSPDLFWVNGGTPKPGVVRPEPDGSGGEFGERFREWRLRMESRRGSALAGTGTWGLIVNTLETTHAGGQADVACAMETFDSLGVAGLTTAFQKDKATTLAAIDSLPNNCAKLYVFWVGHGDKDKLVFPGETPLSAHDFACKLKDQGADEYCLIMTTCFSGSFLDDFEDKGLKGFHVTSTSDSAYTSSFQNKPGAATPFDGAPFSHYLWDCLQKGLRGVDAYQWADSLVQALRDSLVNSADSLRWRKNWGGKYKNDDDPQGGYVHTFASGASATGEPFTFKVASGCSTVCLRFPGLAGSDTCANFTLSCAAQEPSGKKWVKKATYNWNKGKRVYFRTYGLPNATGEYTISMHSNKGGVIVGVRWLGDTATPVTTVNSYVYNAGAIGWIDGSAGEFNASLGEGAFGGHTFSWTDGQPYNNIPAHTGPGWYTQLQYLQLLSVDPDRPFLYNAGDPALGYADNTLLILQAASLTDPVTGLPVPMTNYQVQAFQPMSGNTYGPFAGTIEWSGPSSATTTAAMAAPSQVMLNLGTILPEPLVTTITILGPGVVAWDALLLTPQSSIGTDVTPLPGRPFALALRQNVPNPFNPRTTIRYDIAQTGRVQLAIFDARGRLVRTLVDMHQLKGSHAIPWDGRANAGDAVASGVYFYRLTTQDGTQVRKMTLVR